MKNIIEELREEIKKIIDRHEEKEYLEEGTIWLISLNSGIQFVTYGINEEYEVNGNRVVDFIFCCREEYESLNSHCLLELQDGHIISVQAHNISMKIKL